MNKPLYERQIREMLERTGGVDPPERRWARWRRRIWPLWNRLALWAGRLRWFAPLQQAMVVSYGLAIAAFLLGMAWRPLGTWLGALAATIFAFSYLASLLDSRRQPRPPIWRGRPIDYRGPGRPPRGR
jgi:hypothetical protein